MLTEILSTAGGIGVVYSLSKAVTERSVGWGSVAVCLMLFIAIWSIGYHLRRVLDRLDHIAAALGRDPYAVSSPDDGFNH
jgi:hypothetical protein